MNKEFILEKLKKLQPKYKEEGILLIGLFGSYAQQKENIESDIDILIETTPKFMQKYKGFRAFSKLDELKEDLKNTFKKEIDLVDKVGLKQHNNTFILENSLYVS